MRKKATILIGIWLMLCMLPVACLAEQEFSIDFEALTKKLKQSMSQESPLWNEEQKYVRISHTLSVNVREEPTADSKRVGMAAPNDTYVYLGQEGNWYYIQYDSDTKGYVSANLSIVENESGDIVQDTTGQGNNQKHDKSESKKSPDQSSGSKTCIVCNGNGRCKYCVAGMRYAGGDRMQTCSFCWGSMICYMCGGVGTTP